MPNKKTNAKSNMCVCETSKLRKKKEGKQGKERERERKSV